MMKAVDKFHNQWWERSYVARRDVKWSLGFIGLSKHIKVQQLQHSNQSRATQYNISVES